MQMTQNRERLVMLFSLKFAEFCSGYMLYYQPVFLIQADFVSGFVEGRELLRAALKKSE